MSEQKGLISITDIKDNKKSNPLDIKFKRVAGGGRVARLPEPLLCEEYSTKYFFCKSFGGLVLETPKHKAKPHPIECYARPRNNSGKFVKKEKANE
ncbi:MAG: hypothetical protein LBQ40_03100 [Clostridiales bacterium]|nr:hypothetical protein [Clostridiales bacterium]